MGALMIVLTIILGIVVVLGLITLHELGHFLMAKWAKAYVFEFAIGFGPKLFVIKTKETWYSVRLLPLGGYVSIASDFAEPPKGREEEFNLIPDHRKIDYVIKWKKTLFIIAGPLVNLVIAFILIASFFVSAGYKPNDMTFYGQRFTENSIAFKMIQANEKSNSMTIDSQSVAITGWAVKLNGEKYEHKISYKDEAPKYIDIIYSFIDGLKPINQAISKDETLLDNVEFQFSYLKLANNYSSTTLGANDTGFVRVDQNDAIWKTWKANKQISVGITPPYRNFKSGSSAFGYSFTETWNQSVALLVGLGKFFTGDFNAISGPIGMIKASTGTTSQTTTVSTNYVLYVASISANLFMLNFLPFPPLDGYKFFETLVEWVTRKEVSQKTKTVIYSIGAILLIGLIVIVTIKDFIV